MKNKKGFILADTLIALLLCCISMMLVLAVKEREFSHQNLLERFDQRMMEVKMEISREGRNFPVCTPPVVEKEEEEAS